MVSSGLPGGGAGEDCGAVGLEAAGFDRGAGALGQLAHIDEVVEDDEADGGQLFGAREVGDVVAVVALAGRAGAAGDERLAVAEFMVDQFFWRQEPDMKRIILEATVDSCHELWRFGEPDIDAAVMTTRTAGSIGLYNLCVRRALRGAGLGSALVRSVQSMGREDAVPVVLQCDTVLEAWYRQLDFKKTGILESYARYR